MWSSRNSFYHKFKDTGEEELRSALSKGITTLYNLSFTPLPPRYAPFFAPSLSQILATGIIEQKNWFSLITTAYKSQGIAPSTIFSTNGIPRKWAGLPPIVPLCPPLLTFPDDQLWITHHVTTPHSFDTTITSTSNVFCWIQDILKLDHAAKLILFFFIQIWYSNVGLINTTFPYIVCDVILSQVDSKVITHS